MVRLNSESRVNQAEFPLSYKWDSAVRANYATYQLAIDQVSYHLQRVQRYLFKLSYPYFQQRNILRLGLLRKKQMLGEVSKEELTQYSRIDPCIERYFKSTFSAGLPVSNFSLIAGAGLFAFGTIFNLSITHRLLALALPPFFSFLRLSNDAKSEHRTGQFLDWVLEKRRAECFLEVHGRHINKSRLQALLGSNVENPIEQYQNLLLVDRHK